MTRFFRYIEGFLSYVYGEEYDAESRPGSNRLNLGTKFILLTSSLVLITAFVIGLYVIKDEEQTDYELLLDHGHSLVIMIAENVRNAITREDTDSLRRTADMVISDPAIAYIFILDAQERVLVYKTAQDHPIHIPSMERDGEDPTMILHRSYRNHEDGKYYVNIMAPVIQSPSAGPLTASAVRSDLRRPEIIGYIHLGISQENVKKRISQFIYSILVFTTLIILLGVSVTILVTRRIIRPINDLNRATRDIAEGKLDRQIDIRTNDEVSDLARAFNHMLMRLQASHAKVERHTAELTVALDRMRVEIAERERTEAALKESEKKYRDIFEESKDVIFICSPDGVFLDINRSGAELFGYPSAEGLRSAKSSWAIYANPDERKTLFRMLERQGFVNDHEVKMLRTDGERLTVLVTASAVRNSNSVIIAYRGVLHDVTEKRMLEQQLVQSQKMEAIGQLAGGIAHDFNNILTAIMGYTNLLLMDMPDDSTLRIHAEQILSSSERAANLTRSLLAFSRKQVITPKPVNLNQILNGIREMLMRLIGEEVELKTHSDRNDIMVLGDSGQIEQVLINLCTNARDAMPKGGVLKVSLGTVIVRQESMPASVEKPGAYALLSVIDTGTGIDERIREKIFEPFFTTKETGKGTGLGLSIVYGIIKQHNGFIGIDSDPGRGTTFKLYLPLAEKTAAREDRKLPVRPRGGTETILVAEDDSEVRRLIRLVLTGNGYHVIEAVDGQDALAVLSEQKTKIHLLLLDVIMPKKNGKEVYDTIRLIDPGVRAIFMSGYTADIIDKKGIVAQNLNFIPKPIEPLDLLALVRSVLDRQPH